VVIKTNTLAEEKPVVQETPAPEPKEVKPEPKEEPKKEEVGPKVIDKIDLSKFEE
jgi:hypothetical protein